MRVVILAHALRAAGGRATCLSILDALMRTDGNNQYHLVLPDQPEYRALAVEQHGHSAHYFRRSGGDVGRMLFDALMVPQLVRSYGPDCVWGMGNTGLPKPPCPQAISIQDAHLVNDPRSCGTLSVAENIRNALRRSSLRQALQHTGVVFCQTATMAGRVRQVYGYQGHTVVTGKQVPTLSRSRVGRLPDALAAVRDRFTLLYVTRYYPHKGLELVVEMMDRYRMELDDVTVVTTIEPGDHPRAARLLRYIAKRGLYPWVLNVGAIRPEDLGDYYSACDAVLMPSRLESFSATHLEAMHFGVPILASRLDFAEEVCGDAAIYFDPEDASDMKDAVVQLKSDAALRSDLIAKGRARAALRFSRTWCDIARLITDNLVQLVS